ncbi:hypothetical protein V494_08456 [Pseudogymnoascus sp. VKM F-4513 (FW-928)]|nr:hypothetical protein V494_08456 [Pseudogymnoascus sp. VKM F-4513 (FW-928)]
MTVRVTTSRSNIIVAVFFISVFVIMALWIGRRMVKKMLGSAARCVLTRLKKCHCLGATGLWQPMVGLRGMNNYEGLVDWRKMSFNQAAFLFHVYPLGAWTLEDASPPYADLKPNLPAPQLKLSSKIEREEEHKKRRRKDQSFPDELE